ncbi:MAG: DUF2232 domain-containing protein [Firmicutes bacterium]|nr:DUF2232 domain-containing protein [Bacillota bacterium]
MEMKEAKQSSLLNALLAAGLTVALFYFTTTVMPFLHVLLLFPFVTLYVSEGPKWTGLSMVLTLVAGGILVGWEETLVQAIYFIPASLCMGEMIHRKSEPRDEVLLTSLVIFAAVLGQLFLADKIAGTSWFESVRQGIQAGVEGQLANLGSQVEEADLPALQYQVSVAMDILVHSIPGILYVSSLITALVTGLLSHFISLSSHLDVRPFALADFELSRFWTLVLLGALALGSVFSGNPYYGNAVVVALSLLLLNGMGYIDFRFQWRMIHWMGRLILYFFFIFLVLPGFLALFLGIGDGLLGLRMKFRERGQNHGQNSNE